MKKSFLSHILLSLSVCLLSLASCQVREAGGVVDGEPDIFPDYVGVTLPVNIAPINFMVRDATAIRADFACEGQLLEVVANSGEVVDIPAGKWRKMLQQTVGKTLDITVSVWDDRYPDGVKYNPFSVYISADSIDAYVAYRLIEPGYESWQDMGIYQRELSTFDETPIVTNRQNNGGCLNCHSFQQYNPDRMLFHARGAGGGTVFWKDGDLRKVDMSATNLKMKGVYPMWHKDGRYVVFSSNKTSQSFYSAGRTPIEVYDMSSDIFVYDTETGREIADPRFTEETHLETFPAFSPDGRHLYLCRADSVDFNNNFANLRYSIVRADFHAEDGSLGEKIDTVFDAVATRKSASFPRLSPDGRYLLFTQSDFATFPIWHREADLKMIDLQTGEEMDTTPLNSNETESYHSWSSNGRWVVFSSRRVDSRYTRLFFAHVRADGSFGKPFLLPQRNPMENNYRLKSYNIPEYIKSKATLPKGRVTDLFR